MSVTICSHWMPWTMNCSTPANHNFCLCPIKHDIHASMNSDLLWFSDSIHLSQNTKIGLVRDCCSFSCLSSKGSLQNNFIFHTDLNSLTNHLDTHIPRPVIGYNLSIDNSDWLEIPWRSWQIANQQKVPSSVCFDNHEKTECKDPIPHRMHLHVPTCWSRRLWCPGIWIWNRGEAYTSGRRRHFETKIQHFWSRLQKPDQEYHPIRSTQSWNSVEICRSFLFCYNCDHHNR